VDAVIDVPWTRRAMRDREDAFFCQPSDIADEWAALRRLTGSDDLLAAA
jgi:hypothetical protein